MITKNNKGRCGKVPWEGTKKTCKILQEESRNIGKRKQ